MADLDVQGHYCERCDADWLVGVAPLRSRGALGEQGKHDQEQ